MGVNISMMTSGKNAIEDTKMPSLYIILCRGKNALKFLSLVRIAIKINW